MTWEEPGRYRVATLHGSEIGGFMKSTRIRLAVVGVASFVLLVTVLPQIASSIGLRSLASRLDATTSCSSSGSSSGSSGSSSSSCSSSSSTPNLDGTATGTVTVTDVPHGVKIRYILVAACPITVVWTSGPTPPGCTLTESKRTLPYSIKLMAGEYTLHPGYIATTGSYIRVKTSSKPMVTILPQQTTTKDMTVKYRKP
jgi:hypothetical protein